jgi:hypothetical protein
MPLKRSVGASIPAESAKRRIEHLSSARHHAGYIMAPGRRGRPTMNRSGPVHL